jgi:tetratricopeptide (TPR) repeat protein
MSPGVARRRRRVPFWLAGLMVTVVTGGASPAAAAPAAEDLAVGLYQRSAELYRQGRFAEAAVLLREAYRHRPDPVLQYNLARACEEMGDFSCAVEAYEKYLAGANPSDRSVIEQRLARCRARLAERSSAPAVPASAMPQVAHVEQPPRSAMGRVLPLITAGAGGAALGVGTVLALAARSRHEEAVRDPVQRTAAERQSQAASMMKTANAVLVSGAVVAVGATIWWLVGTMLARSATRPTGVVPASTDRVLVDIGSHSVWLALQF